MAEPFDVASCEMLAVQGAKGDAEARRILIERLWPAWIEMVQSSRSMGSLARSEDHVRNVATRLVEKIQKNNGHSLRLYSLWLERHPGKTFLDWIRIMTANAVRNYVTAQIGPRKQSSEEPSAKRVLNEFASSALLEEVGVRPKVTVTQTARELLEFAEEHLPAEQQRVLRSWLEGANFDDIAVELGIDSERVKLLQRRAISVLRRHFRDEKKDPA